MNREIEERSQLSVDGLPVINRSGLPDVEITASASMREVASQLSRWVDNARNASGRSSMFDRGMFTPPDNPYDEMRAARNALRYDSVVSGVAEITEGYAFQGVKWESTEPDEADVFNQMATDQNLDGVLRSMWREEFGIGQFVAAMVWGYREYTVRGQTKKGNQRKKVYRVWAPLKVSILDSLKIVPVGIGPLGGDMLAWQATPGEVGYYQSAYAGEITDPLFLAFFRGAYTPSIAEMPRLVQWGVSTNDLLVLDPANVFRHTITRPDYQPFADIRMKSIFTLLDLKRQLMQSDRASLIGNANYIVLVRKGLKDEPADPEELANLRENYNVLAKMPVIISDHRLSIEIVAPKTDFTLEEEKYDVLNSQILSRLLGTLTLGQSQRGESQQSIASALAKVMESRRHMLRRTLEARLARAVVRHPRNAGVFKTEPNLVFTPRSIALALDSTYLQALMALRTQRELSRESILEFFGLDQATEAMRMEIEEEFYDKIFKTEIPYSKGLPAQDIDTNLRDDPNAVKPGKTTPNGTPEAPSVSGGRGGRPKGGGSSKKSVQGQVKPRTSSGNPSTRKG